MSTPLAFLLGALTGVLMSTILDIIDHRRKKKARTDDIEEVSIRENEDTEV